MASTVARPSRRRHSPIVPPRATAAGSSPGTNSSSASPSPASVSAVPPQLARAASGRRLSRATREDVHGGQRGMTAAGPPARRRRACPAAAASSVRTPAPGLEQRQRRAPESSVSVPPWNSSATSIPLRRLVDRPRAIRRPPHAARRGVGDPARARPDPHPRRAEPARRSPTPARSRRGFVRAEVGPVGRHRRSGALAGRPGAAAASSPGGTWTSAPHSIGRQARARGHRDDLLDARSRRSVTEQSPRRITLVLHHACDEGRSLGRHVAAAPRARRGAARRDDARREARPARQRVGRRGAELGQRRAAAGGVRRPGAARGGQRARASATSRARSAPARSTRSRARGGSPELQRELVARTRLGIPAIAHEECLTGFTTSARPSSRRRWRWGASFDPELRRADERAIGETMRAVGVHQGLSPVLDVVRDYRWGRVEETIGEDPYLVGTIGTRLRARPRVGRRRRDAQALRRLLGLAGRAATTRRCRSARASCATCCCCRSRWRCARAARAR